MASAMHNTNVGYNTIPPKHARLIHQSMPRTHQLDSSFNLCPSLCQTFNTHPILVTDPLSPLLPSSCHDFHLNLPQHLLIPIHVAHGHKLATCLCQTSQTLTAPRFSLDHKTCHTLLPAANRNHYLNQLTERVHNCFQDYLHQFVPKLQSTLIHIFTKNVVKMH